MRVFRPVPRQAQVELWGAQRDYGLQMDRPIAAECVGQPFVLSKSFLALVALLAFVWNFYIVGNVAWYICDFIHYVFLAPLFT